jgi:hypothetical protein
MHVDVDMAQRQPNTPLPYPVKERRRSNSMRIILRLQPGTARRTPTKQKTALEETLDSK